MILGLLVQRDTAVNCLKKLFMLVMSCTWSLLEFPGYILIAPLIILSFYSCLYQGIYLLDDLYFYKNNNIFITNSLYLKKSSF
jgi:hypothetical protein